MKLIKALFCVVIFCACSQEESRENSSSMPFETLSSASKTTQANTKPQIAAFIKSSDTNEMLFKSYQLGVELAQQENSTLFDVNFFDYSLGSSTDSEKLKALVDNGSIPMAIYWNTGDVVPVASYLSQGNVVGMVAYEVTKKIIPLGASIFGFGYSTENTFKDLTKFAGNKLKSYRFAVIKSTDAKFDIQNKVFIEETKSLGNTIVFEEAISDSSVDFSALVKKAQKENCDTIFAALPAKSLVELIRIAKNIGFKGKILTGDTLFSSDINTLGRDAEGIYFVQTWSDDQKLKEYYSAKFGNTPDGITLGVAALGYDTIKCLQGVGNTFDASSIKYSLLSQPCEGITGNTYFTGERMAQRKMPILTVKDGVIIKAQ